MSGDLPEQPQGPRLHPPGFEIADLSEHSLGHPVGLLHVSGAEIGLSAGEGRHGEIAIRNPTK